MKSIVRVVLIGVFCLGVAVAGAYEAMRWLDRPIDLGHRRIAKKRPGNERSRRPATPEAVDTSGPVNELFERGGFDVVLRHGGACPDPSSIESIREFIASRPGVVADRIEGEIARLKSESDGRSPAAARALGLKLLDLGQLFMYQGQFERAEAAFRDAYEVGRASSAPSVVLSQMTALRGINALRIGETRNCVECATASSCVFPLDPNAVHQQPEGSRKAVAFFEQYLADRPQDLRVQWLLNVATMTLGQYPVALAPRLRVPLDRFNSEEPAKAFENVALDVGLSSCGPAPAGGCAFDDFSGDGIPDLITSSLSLSEGLRYFVNQGDGTFRDATPGSGLEDQPYALNISHADFDNDGDLDLLILRGAWEAPLRLSLMANRGDGRFDDVTVAAGMAEPISSISAAWADYDGDGFLDVYVCGDAGLEAAQAPIPAGQKACRLYRNRGDGTFENRASEAGVTNDRTTKGAAWGDYDNDGRPDLLVSNLGQACRLYHNQGDGTFADVAKPLQIEGPELGFACWFWDFDNDGCLDLYVAENMLLLGEEVAGFLGQKTDRISSPRLYRNMGPDGFADVTAQVALNRGLTPMGCNFGDIDNDGYPDIYFGTGGMSFEHIVPNRLFRNQAGSRFTDVTTATATGHLQKGHGVALADFDRDGDLDIFVNTGGPSPGDASYDPLFRNPGNGNHWLRLKLVGTRSNRSAIGARVRVVPHKTEGAPPAVFQTVGQNSSFGGNPLELSIGLGPAQRIDELVIDWPTTGTRQVFRNLAVDQAIVVTEGSDRVETRAQPASARASTPIDERLR